MKFVNGKEMLETIKKQDIYNDKTGKYVFLYSDDDSICVYRIGSKQAVTLSETGEPWSYHLGVGGTIYDDESSRFYSDGDMTNLDWCNENYEGEWWEV